MAALNVSAGVSGTEKNLSSRDFFLQQGAQLIQGELKEQADLAMEQQQEVELRNVDLLSMNIIANKDVNKTVRGKIQEYSQNIQKILFATAHFIEKEKFATVDEAVKNIRLSKFDKKRLETLVSAQKNLSFSYSTLSAVIEIFKIANKNILDEIAQTGFADTIDKRLDKTNLYLKNAIIVYELTNFTVNYLSTFQLNGVDDIKAIQKQVYQDMEKLHLDDEQMKKRTNVSDIVRDRTLQDIEQRAKMSEKIKEKWESMINQIEGQLDGVNKAKGFVEDLKMIRDNTKNRIDILNITATTALVENSINAISELASNMQVWALPPLDEKAACELLGVQM